MPSVVADQQQPLTEAGGVGDGGGDSASEPPLDPSPPPLGLLRADSLTNGTEAFIRLAKDHGNKVLDAEDPEEIEAKTNGHADTDDYLLFRDDRQQELAFTYMNTMRKNREFCDVVFFFGNKEIFAHKAVLAASSAHLYDLFTGKDLISSPGLVMESASGSSPLAMGGQPEENGGEMNGTGGGGPPRDEASPPIAPEPKHDTGPTVFEFRDMDSEAFQALVNYTYTSCLEVAPNKVKNLYKMASWLKMRPCAKACARYLADRLKPDNSIGIRACANGTNDTLLANRVDDYIQQNFAQIINLSREFASLPCIRIQVMVGSEASDDAEILSNQMIQNGRQLSTLVLEYLESFLGTMGPQSQDCKLEQLVSKVHMLYMNDDLTLHDCCDTSDSSAFGGSQSVQDYKKSARRTSYISTPNKHINVRGSPTPLKEMTRISSCDSLASSQACDEVEWKLIAVHRSAEMDTYYIAVAIIARHLTALSIQFKDTAMTPNSGPLMDTTSFSLISSRRSDADDSIGEDSIPLSQMSTPRCAVGAIYFEGRIIVCGGYERGECLNTVEVYDLAKNEWQPLPPMFEKRGRVDVALCDSKIYVVGGSDGSQDLDSAECFDIHTESWTKIASLPFTCSNNGCCSINGKVYSIGGYNGQYTIRHCLCYDPETDQWEPIATLDQGRYQAACVAWNGQVLVVGGCDAWNCVNTVMSYNPTTNQWSHLPSLSTVRRGSGAGIFAGKLYIVGGSDGTQALNSVEIFDPETGSWSKGPSLSVPRANVRAVVAGNKLFALGGFSGRQFLNNIEYLEEGASEWKTFLYSPES